MDAGVINLALVLGAVSGIMLVLKGILQPGE